MASSFEPYLGPRPFTRDDAHRFFGRTREANDLVSLVTAHAVTLVFGKPGTGKSSLLNAQVLPQLEAEEFKVLPTVRFGSRTSSETEIQVPNIYVFKTVTAWAEDGPNQKNLAELSLSEFLVKAGEMSRWSEPRIAVFDQFEELFLEIEHWQAREQFLMQIRDALDNDRMLRVVFLMREESLGELDPYIHLLPDILRIRFRLEPLRKAAALSALISPLESTERRFAEGVAERLIEDLLTIRIRTPREGWKNVQGQYVDPVQLQVVGQSLWESLAPEEKTITREHLKDFGDVDKSLTVFYESVIASATAETGISEAALRRWFERSLITPNKTRGIVYQGEENTAGIPNRVVNQLVAQRLVRAELRSGGVWYELAHDRLIQPILDSNEQWLRASPLNEQTRARWESRAEQWVVNNRPTNLLFSEAELIEAEHLIGGPEAKEVGGSEQLFSLISASKAASVEKDRELEFVLAREAALRMTEEAQNRRRIRLLAVLLALVSLVALAAIARLWMQ